MPHILVVCTANICRSPVGEALLIDRLQKHGYSDFTVSSAGTWAMVERGAAANSIQIMAEQGLDIREHRAQMIEGHHLQEADLALCMESGHAEALRAEFPAFAHKIFLMSNMIGKHYSISDPYGGPLPSYGRMATDLTHIIDEGLERIVELAQANATIPQ